MDEVTILPFLKRGYFPLFTATFPLCEIYKLGLPESSKKVAASQQMFATEARKH
jgi:hypothetical protein